jgi:hypothetical protein
MGHRTVEDAIQLLKGEPLLLSYLPHLGQICWWFPLSGLNPD